ncbi:hypothetical protein BYT27DRAFT_7193163 [Phlegmacium glaucopus]|nr:hypothetical protein BYT27DRAFT_7193163 [Phlegmacium glaucopus]
MSTENITQPEFDQDVQLEIMTALAFIQLKWRISPLPFPDPPTTTSNERQMLYILNWIASFFVRDPKGDCVASALSVEDHKITLYLAANRGRPQDEDIQNGNKLISTLRQAFHEPKPKTAQRLLFDSAISITYRRFFHKIDMIKDIRFRSRNDGPIPVGLLIEMFETLVTKWAKAGGVEGNQKFIHFVRSTLKLTTYESGGEGEGANALKALFEYFVKSIKPQADLDPPTIRTRAWASCQIAMQLVFSDFFSRVVPIDAQGLRRRLWRVARYWIDAGSVATSGTKWIKKVLGNNELTEGGDCFTVVWVGAVPGTLPENHGRKYFLNDCPVDHFKRLLEEFGFEETSQIKQQSFMTNLGALWPKPKEGNPPTITPFLHCELQIISYLDQHNITAHMNLIGVSKLMCWACDIYVKEINKCRMVDGKKPYVLSGTSGKAHEAWLIPPGEPGDVVADIIRVALKVAISNMATMYGHRRIHSGGSDSSTGSRESPYQIDDPESSEEDEWSEYRDMNNIA